MGESSCDFGVIEYRRCSSTHTHTAHRVSTAEADSEASARCRRHQRSPGEPRNVGAGKKGSSAQEAGQCALRKRQTRLVLLNCTLGLFKSRHIGRNVT